MSHIDMMKTRVKRLDSMSQCLQHSKYPDIGLEQRRQLNDMSSELDAMRDTCADRMKLSGDVLLPSQRPVRANTSLIV